MWQVYRDGKPISEELESENACFAWTLMHQPQSVDWAMRYEHYTWHEDGEQREPGTNYPPRVHRTVTG